MNAQLQVSDHQADLIAVQSQMMAAESKKKPRMTPKRLQQELQNARDEGREAAYKTARDEYEQNKLSAAWWNFAAGAIIGCAMVAPALRWAWHAFQTFVAANAH